MLKNLFNTCIRVFPKSLEQSVDKALEVQELAKRMWIPQDETEKKLMSTKLIQITLALSNKMAELRMPGALGKNKEAQDLL
jgi:hypothetical protein